MLLGIYVAVDIAHHSTDVKTSRISALHLPGLPCDHPLFSPLSLEVALRSRCPSRLPGPHRESWRLAQQAPTVCTALKPRFSGMGAGKAHTATSWAPCSEEPGLNLHQMTATPLFLINGILLSVINIFHVSHIYSCKIVYDIIPSPTVRHLSINSMKTE